MVKAPANASIPKSATSGIELRGCRERRRRRSFCATEPPGGRRDHLGDFHFLAGRLNGHDGRLLELRPLPVRPAS